MRRAAPWLGLLALVGLASCARPSGRAPARPKVLVTVSATPADAEIWVNSRFVGTVAEAAGGLRLPLGTHEVELMRQGYFPYLAVLELAAEGAPRRLEVALFPVVTDAAPP